MSDKYPWSKYQLDFFENISHGSGHTMVEAVAGSGKCLGIGTPVLMYDGHVKPVEDIKQGDRLMGPDSKPRKVLSTNVGTGRLYKVKPAEGDHWVCNDEHVLTLIRDSDEIIDISVTNLFERGYLLETEVYKYYKLFKVDPAKSTEAYEITSVSEFSLEDMGIGDYYGFTLDQDGRFLLGDFTVTHNTSSIIEGLEYVPDHLTWLLVAFSKRIATELKAKAPSSGEVRTLHSLGLKSLARKFKGVKVANDKVDVILKKLIGKDKSLWDLRRSVKKGVSLSKCYLAEGAEFIDIILDKHDIDTFGLDRGKFIEHVQTCLKACAQQTREVDFDDMIWMPYVHKVPVPKYDMVFIDECQDLNNCQLELALKASKRGGRIFALGDHNQAIFGFMGANKDSVSTIKKRLNAKSMPLSISYRCPIKVVKEAQRYVPHMEAAPNAEEGVVGHISIQDMRKAAKPGSVILSRLNAPLVSHAMYFIKKGVPANIMGKDIGENLLNLIKKSRRKDLDSFLDWLEKWEKKEINRLRSKNRGYEHIVDKAQCLRAIADSAGSLPELKTKIINLFEDTDEHTRITLSSVHKFKGLERDIVFVLWGTVRSFSQEERNIAYVAVSRSALELYLVT